MEVMIRTDENDLKNLLDVYINDENVKKLIYDIISTNSNAVEWLFKFHLGHIYPMVPKIGTVGYVNIDKYNGWSGDVDKYKNSKYTQHGFLKVTVQEFKGLNSYHPLIVTAPVHEENGVLWNNSFHIQCSEFILEDDLDTDFVF
jgi:hypothetical protein